MGNVLERRQTGVRRFPAVDLCSIGDIVGYVFHRHGEERGRDTRERKEKEKGKGTGKCGEESGIGLVFGAARRDDIPPPSPFAASSSLIRVL